MGRPRQFDETNVLQRAAEVFWAKGYEGTSTRDLAECTGLTTSSIYNEFGDKRGLYLRALDQYLNQRLRERITRLEATLPPGRVIGAYFDEVIGRLLGDPRHRGCLLVNTALEVTPDDPELQRRVADELAEVEAFFRRNIIAGQQSGELSPEPDAGDMARLLLSLWLGLRVLARVRPDRDLLESMLRPALAMLDPAPEAGRPPP